MVMAPHWGDHFLSVDLRTDEISSTPLYVNCYPNQRFGQFIMEVIGSSPTGGRQRFALRRAQDDSFNSGIIHILMKKSPEENPQADI